MGTARAHTPQVDALDLLIEQHDKIDQLFAQLEVAQLAQENKAIIFQALADEVAAHTAIEEQLFYPAVRAKVTDDRLPGELLNQAPEEHLAIKRMLAELLITELDDAQFDARLATLKRALEEHVHQTEEARLFPALRGVMSADELAALGGEMMALFEQLMTQEPRLRIPTQTYRPAPL
jgi:iron-sulfur cluster repair protein YtfE (RIC family)